MEWLYDTARHEYRNAATGAILAAAALRSLKNDYLGFARVTVAHLAERVASGAIAVDAWEAAMRTQVLQGFALVTMLGRGGRSALTPHDVGQVAAAAAHQWGYLGDFADDIKQGRMSQAGTAARAGLYVDAATHLYERARAAGYGGLDLPAYPADGSQQCLGRCRCAWVIEETEQEWRATWELDGDAEHCDSCEENAAQWSPLVVPK